MRGRCSTATASCSRCLTPRGQALRIGPHLFRSGCPLSRSGFFHRLVGGFGDFIIWGVYFGYARFDFRPLSSLVGELYRSAPLRCAIATSRIAVFWLERGENCCVVGLPPASMRLNGVGIVQRLLLLRTAQSLGRRPRFPPVLEIERWSTVPPMPPHLTISTSFTSPTARPLQTPKRTRSPMGPSARA